MSADPDRAALSVCPLTLPCRGIVSELSSPIPPRRASRRTRVLICGHIGSRRRSDRTSVIVGDASFLLDHSGCRELPSGSVHEGKWRRAQHYKTNVGVYNTVWALTCLKGRKAPFLSYPGGTFLQACRVRSSVLRLTRVPCHIYTRRYKGVARKCRARRTQPSDIGRGGASPQTLDEVELALRCWARWTQPSDVYNSNLTRTYIIQI